VATLDKVSLDIAVVLGATSMPIHQALRLGRGAIIELDASEEDEVKILVNNFPVARGTVVVSGNRIAVELKEMLSRKGGVLSGGQQQQLAIGRALLTNPKLLILDEPTEGIQPNIVQQIEAALARIRKDLGVAILIVEQNLDFAWSFADHYFVMQRGRIVKHGATEDTTTEEVAHLIHV